MKKLMMVIGLPAIALAENVGFMGAKVVDLSNESFDSAPWTKDNVQNLTVGDNAVEFSAKGSIEYTADPSSVMGQTVTSVHQMRFTIAEPENLSTPSADAQASVTAVWTDDECTTAIYKVLANGEWVSATGEGSPAPVTDQMVTLTVTIDYVQGKVKYNIDGQDLADENGNVWFVNANNAVGKITKMRVSGNGAFGDFNSTYVENSAVAYVDGASEARTFYGTLNDATAALASGDTITFPYAQNDLTVNKFGTFTTAGEFTGVVKLSDGTEFTKNDNTWSAGLTGAGTEDDPFVVASVDDFKWLRYGVNTMNPQAYGLAGQFFKQTANIDMSGESWAAIGNGNYPFCATFDGDNKEITNLTPNGVGYQGLFGVAVGTTMKNMRLSGTITTGAGGLLLGYPNDGAGRTTNNFINITVSGNLAGSGNIGGFMGWIAENALTRFVACTNLANVSTSATKCGGFIGYSDKGDIEYLNCRNAGNITVNHQKTNDATISAGGFNGYVNSIGKSIFDGCVNDGTITANQITGGSVDATDGACAGGFMGRVTGGAALAFNGCANNGSIAADGNSEDATKAAGFVALMSANSFISLTDSTNATTAITTANGTSSMVAAFVGDNKAYAKDDTAETGLKIVSASTVVGLPILGNLETPAYWNKVGDAGDLLVYYYEESAWHDVTKDEDVAAAWEADGVADSALAANLTTAEQKTAFDAWARGVNEDGLIITADLKASTHAYETYLMRYVMANVHLLSATPEPVITKFEPAAGDDGKWSLTIKVNEGEGICEISKAIKDYVETTADLTNGGNWSGYTGLTEDDVTINAGVATITLTPPSADKSFLRIKIK